MSIRRINNWGGSRSIRLESECKELNINATEDVYVHIVDGKIVIEKMPETFKVKDGVVFNIQE